MKFSQKNFENWRFWKMAILKNRPFWIFFFGKKKYFCLIPMKISHKLCDSINGTQFWWFPWFPANSLLCVIYRYTVYIWKCENILYRKNWVQKTHCGIFLAFLVNCVLFAICTFYILIDRNLLKVFRVQVVCKLLCWNVDAGESPGYV